MVPSPMPYNLRSRGRVVGMRLLRRRQAVQLDESSSISGKHSHRCRRPKRDRPFTGSLVPEDPLSKEEQERKRRKPDKPFTGSIVLEDPLSEEEEEEEEDEDEEEKRVARDERLIFLERTFPHPFLAMEHYNKNLKEEDQYMVSDLAEGKTMYYSKLGFVHLLHIEALPKSLEDLPNSSNSVHTKHFLAIVHEPPNCKSHVSDCQLFSGPPKSGTPISKIIPLSCEVCQLKDVAAFESRSRALRQEAEARKSETGQDDPDSDYDGGFSDPDSRKYYWHTPRSK